ncbi:MAG: AAA family ATPase, partial [archaeon]|nr:AAA family ATPase [archaeon]
IFERKIEKLIEMNFEDPDAPILLIQGARQVGKSSVIRRLASTHFKHFVEINMATDKAGNRLFADIANIKDIYFAIQTVAGTSLGTYADTIVFLDEIQEYSQLFTSLKFLREDRRYRFIGSGSRLRTSLRKTLSIPIGSISIEEMHPLDFEEFLWAKGMTSEFTGEIKEMLKAKRSLPEGTHKKLMDDFKDYLIAGGLPHCVDLFLSTGDIAKVRDAQMEVYSMYGDDATEYDRENKKYTKRVLDLIPPNIDIKRKRSFSKDIEGKQGTEFEQYWDSFDDLIDSGVASMVTCCTNPRFRVFGSTRCNLPRLYLADVGILTALLYRYDVKPLREDLPYAGLGNVYDCVTAMQLKSNDGELFYYNRK